MRPEDENPEVVEPYYVRVLLEPRRCLECTLPILPDVGTSDPNSGKLSLRAQWTRAGWPQSAVFVASRCGYVCSGCADKRGITWQCALCEQDRTGDPQEEVGGDPPENLCTPCHETVPAKLWDDAKKRLAEKHRYDFC